MHLQTQQKISIGDFRTESLCNGNLDLLKVHGNILIWTFQSHLLDECVKNNTLSFASLSAPKDKKSLTAKKLFLFSCFLKTPD